MTSPDRSLVSKVGPVQIDWPRSAGYYGGVALAIGLGLIEAPLGVFIAAIPLLKMLDHPNAPLPARMVSQFLDGAAKPVGGDAESTFQVVSSGDGHSPGLLTAPVNGLKSIWRDAQALR